MHEDYSQMDQKIIRFLRRHHVFTLSTVSELGCWTAHCFYAFMPDNQALVFTTDPGTRHGSDMLQNPMVSGGIMLETKVIGKIRGIQFSGQAIHLENNVTTSLAGAPADATSLPSDPLQHPIHNPMRAPLAGEGESRMAYLKRFPFALAVKPDLWILYIDYIKMTDNRLGFGRKLEWRREAGG